jgi:hypothetical protein
MKNRVSFFIGLSIFFISCFAILILVSYAQKDIPELANAQEMIKKAFPNSKITWSKEIEEEMVNFKAASTALAIMIGNGDKRMIEFINFKDTIDWEIECDRNSCRHYEVIGGDYPRLSIKKVDWILGTRVIDAKGEEIFDLNLKSWLYPSHSAKYYYTKDNPDSYNELKVYNANGEFLWKRKTPGLRVWFSHAFSDSQLIYLDYRGCFLLNALTGEEIWRVPWLQFGQTIMGFPKIFSSSDGQYFIITDSHGLISINSIGKILWSKKIERTILATALSEDGKFVVIYAQKRKAKDEKRLELLNNFSNGQSIWDIPIETPIKDYPSEIHGLTIRVNKISLTPGMVPYYTSKGITPQMQTFYFEIDTESGELLNKYAIDGVSETIINDNQKVHFLLVHTKDKKEIFRIEQGVIK